MLHIAPGLRGWMPGTEHRNMCAISRGVPAPVRRFSALEARPAGPGLYQRRNFCRAVSGSGQEAPGLQDGQLLLLPGKKGQAPPGATVPAKQRGSGPVNDLWAGWGSHVKDIGLQRVEELLARCGCNANDQDVLLVVYAPWCSYCQSIETEVEHLAASLAHDKKVVVAKLRGDVPGARYFVKQSLQVQTLPTVLLFPRNSRMFFKHRSPQRDANSLLRFMNSLCKKAGDQPWTLGGPGAQRHVSSGSSGGGGGSSSNEAAVKQLLQLAKPPEASQHQHQHQQLKQQQQWIPQQINAHQQLQQQHVQQQQQIMHTVHQQVQHHGPVLEALALRGQMAGLAAVLGVSLAVGHMWQGTHGSSPLSGLLTRIDSSSDGASNGSSSTSGATSSSGGSNAAANELDSSISNVVGLLVNLLRLRVGLIATAMHSTLLGLLPQAQQLSAAFSGREGSAASIAATSSATIPAAAPSAAGVAAPAAAISVAHAADATHGRETEQARALRMMQAEAGLFAAQPSTARHSAAQHAPAAAEATTSAAAAAAAAVPGSRAAAPQQQGEPAFYSSAREHAPSAQQLPSMTAQSYAAMTSASAPAPARPAVPRAGIPAAAWGAQAAQATATAGATAAAAAAAAAAGTGPAAAQGLAYDDVAYLSDLAAVTAIDLEAARHGPLPGQQDEALLTQETIEVDKAESAAILDALLERGTAADVDAFLASLLQQRQ